jgi:N-acetylneuraminic acid mutarotase
MIGGDFYVTCSDKGFWKYDTKNNEWTSRKETTYDRGHTTGLAVNGKGYYGLGEMSGNRYRDILEYDPAKDQWTKIAEAPFQYTRNGFFAVGDNIYFLVGAFDSYSVSDTRGFYKFNITTRTWTRLKDFPGKANMDTFGFSIGSRGYVVAGWYNENGGSTFTNEVWEYTPLYDEWERKADYPNAIIGLAGCSVGEKAYVGCGSRFSGYSYTDFYLFDPDK